MTMKKALRISLFAVGYVLAYFFVLILFLYLADLVAANFQLRHIDLVAFVFGNVLMIGLLLYFRHKTREQWIRVEAKQWLAERSQPPVYARSRRLWRTVLWIPSVFVLAIFLFLPEAVGLVSHLFCGPTVRLRQYRLKIPPTWIVETSSDSSAWVIAGKGIGRVGIRRYWRREEPISEASFYAGSDLPSLGEWYLSHARILSKPTLRLGQRELTCLDIVSYSDSRPFPTNPSFAEIFCSSDQHDFNASFYGQRSDSSAFYDLLRGATEVK
jgi:hypothetical protein